MKTLHTPGLWRHIVLTPLQHTGCSAFNRRPTTKNNADSRQQKQLSNQRGIFLTFVLYCSDEDKPDNWRNEKIGADTHVIHLLLFQWRPRVEDARASLFCCLPDSPLAVIDFGFSRNPLQSPQVWCGFGTSLGALHHDCYLTPDANICSWTDTAQYKVNKTGVYSHARSSVRLYLGTVAFQAKS